MPASPPPISGSRRRDAMIFAALATAGVLILLAVLTATRPDLGAWTQTLFAASGIGAVVALCTAFAIAGLSGSEGDAARSVRTIEDLLREQVRLLAQVHEHTMLSEGGKRLLYRAKELDLLRHAIEEDIARGDYDAALTMCTTMAEEFGFRVEAETFRETIESMRREHVERSVQESLAALDAALNDRDWMAARHEAARIRRLYPDAPAVDDLEPRIERARQAHKTAMIERFVTAADHGEDETAMALLRELDRSLSREDAAMLQERAQGVVARHRENLSVQFNIAVRDRNWAEAVRVGNDIVREFPNSKMAEEVRSMIDVLQTRATQAAVQAAS
ncbi:MAG TPA: hypothetical protein PKC43_08335 [Phycisphaerales bacterium]|nr:hypothetical protein [Phycisphaerales bacterium]HMP37443.1 hypothetical protein [Phycisphaerales bacterium]